MWRHLLLVFLIRLPLFVLVGSASPERVYDYLLSSPTQVSPQFISQIEEICKENKDPDYICGQIIDEYSGQAKVFKRCGVPLKDYETHILVILRQCSSYQVDMSPLASDMSWRFCMHDGTLAWVEGMSVTLAVEFLHRCPNSPQKCMTLFRNKLGLIGRGVFASYEISGMELHRELSDLTMHCAQAAARFSRRTFTRFKLCLDETLSRWILQVERDFPSKYNFGGQNGVGAITTTTTFI